MKKNMNLTKGKISKLYKLNKQTRKKKCIPSKNNKKRNVNTFRKRRWIDLSKKTLKKMSGGNGTELNAKLPMPEIDSTSFKTQNISEELINELPEEMLQDIMSGSIFEPIEPTENKINDTNAVIDTHVDAVVEHQEKDETSNPFDSVNNVAHILASSSSLPLPVYGGKKRFRLTREKHKKREHI